MSLESQNINSDRVFDEFSPKKLLFQLKSVIDYVISKWLIILLIAILCAIATYYYTILKKPTYLAVITFALDDGVAANTKSPYAKLEQEFGIELGTDAGGVFSSTSNIVELIQSRLLIEKTLKSTVTINKHKLLFADFFLDSLDYREKWTKNRPNSKINFNNNSKNPQEILFANSIINNIYELIITKYIKVEPKGAGTSILQVSCLTENQFFSKYFLEALLNQVTKYYIDTKTQRSKINLAFLQKKTDSVQVEYFNAMYGRASFSDAHLNPSKQVGVVTKDKQQTDVQILKNSYAELVKSLEAAKNNLNQETPLFQFLDIPVLPLKTFNANAIKNSFMVFIISIIIMAMSLFIKKVFQKLIK